MRTPPAINATPPRPWLPRGRWIRLGIGVLWLLLVMAPAVVWADWVINGSAFVSGGNVVITPAAGNQVGAAWLNSRVDLAHDFDLSMSVYLGSSDSGADGLSIVLQNDPRGTAAVGDIAGGGEWIGMHTIGPALAVEIDTFQNSNRQDPPSDHIAINEFISPASLPNHAGAEPVAVANIEDGANHLLRLSWSSAARTLTIYWDSVWCITYSKDFITTIFGGNTQLWFGVAGSTGGAYNLQRFQPLLTNRALTLNKSVLPAQVDPGHLVTYTITLQNNGAIPATVSQIADLLPAGFIYQPGTSSGWSSSDPVISGQSLTWSGAWSLGPGQSQTLNFQAQSPITPGLYFNSATVRGTDVAEITVGPAAPVLVNGAPLPAQGSKPLYLYSSPSNRVSRTAPAGPQPGVVIGGGNGSATWSLSPALSSAVTINGDARRIPIELLLQRSAWGTSRSITVALSSASLGTIGTTGPQSYAAIPTSGPALFTINVPISGDITLPPGDTFSLTVANHTSQGTRSITVYPVSASTYSRVVLDSRSVIQVDGLAFYNAAYPGGVAISAIQPGQTVFIRAAVSDPFGSFDISGALIQIINPSNQIVVNNVSMTPVFDSGAALKIYEHAQVMAAEGIWTVQVTAQEGAEGLVRHSRAATLLASAPDLLLVKSVITLFDPVHGGTNPKAIPGAVMVYTLAVSNQGRGAVDNDATVIMDAIAPRTALYVGDLGQPAGPVAFADGPAPSGLNYTFLTLGSTTDDLSFSNNNGLSFDYSPVPDALGFDSQVTHIRVHPQGVFAGASGGIAPAFTLRFRVSVK